MIYWEWEKSIEYYVARDNLQIVNTKLIQQFEARGQLQDLVVGALAQNPGNPALQDFARSVGLAS
jgi:hypothetical protein